MSKITLVRIESLNLKSKDRLLTMFPNFEWVDNLEGLEAPFFNIMTPLPISFKMLNQIVENNKDVIICVVDEDEVLHARELVVVESISNTVIDLRKIATDETPKTAIRHHVIAYLDDTFNGMNVFENAYDLAKGMSAKLTVLAVVDFEHELPSKHQYLDVFNYAKSKGAYVSLLNGSDAAYQVSEYVKLSNATTLVMAVSEKQRRFYRKNFSTRIFELLPDIQIIALPQVPRVSQLRHERQPFSLRQSLKDFAIAASSLVLTTGIALIMKYFHLDPMNILAIYLIAILLISMKVFYRMIALISALSSVLIFNYMFVAPHYQFIFSQKAYIFTIYLMVIFAMVIYQMSHQSRKNTKEATLKSFKTELLLQASLKLQSITSPKQAYWEMGKLIAKLTQSDITYFLDPNDLENCITLNDAHDVTHNADAIAWLFEEGTQTTSHVLQFIEEDTRYYAIIAHDHTVSVIRATNTRSWTPFIEDSFVTLISELGLVLESMYLQEQLRHQASYQTQQKTKQRIVRTMSHDLRTPLTSIMGNLEAMAHDTDSKPLQEKIGDIYQEVVWLNNLVDNMLLLNQFDGDMPMVGKERFVLQEILEEAIERMRLRYKNRTIQFIDTQDVVLVEANVQLLIQLFVNLLENAFKFSSERDPVIVRIMSDKTNVSVCIEDFGVGISDHEKENVYDMFHTKASDYEDAHRGLGIGLFLCKNIVVLHEGSLEIQDNTPQGTIFKVSLRKEQGNYGHETHHLDH